MGSDLVPVGRVGRPHGIDGSFFVEGPSDEPKRSRTARRLRGRRAGQDRRVEARAQGRPVIRLDRAGRARRARSAVPREALPPLDEDEYYAFQLVGPRGRGGGRPRPRAGRGRARLPCQRRARAGLGRVPAARRGLRAEGGSGGRANRRRAGFADPRHDAHRRLHTRAARIRVAHGAAADRGRARRRARAAPLQLSRHDAAARGAGRRRRRTAAAQAWCCASTSSQRRSRRPTATSGRAPRDRADAAGPAADAGRSSRSSRRAERPDAALVALRGLRRADRPASRDRRDLDRAVRALERRPAGDGAARRGRAAAARARSPRARASSRASPRSSTAALEYPHYTRPAEFRGWSVPDVLLSGDHAKIEAWRREHVR